MTMLTQKILRRLSRWTFIRNYYHTTHSKNVLISYLTHPFVYGVHLGHTNMVESISIAKVFSDMGYNVDIIDFNNPKRVDYKKYDIVFGFGKPFEKSFYAIENSPTRIFYGTGEHPYALNIKTLQRVIDVFKKKNKLIVASSRYISEDHLLSTMLADGIITLGNRETADSYREFSNGNIHVIPASYHRIAQYQDILSRKNFKSAQSNFLFFSGAGMIHKGLDLLLETFVDKPELHLHICAPIDFEPEFKTCYSRELYKTPNIHVHGFVGLDSQLFQDLLSACGFVIFPSCSEGGGASIINVMANGGLLPIVTKDSSIDIGDYGIAIEDLTVEAVTSAVAAVSDIREEEFTERTFACARIVSEAHSSDVFLKKLQHAITKITNNKLK